MNSIARLAALALVFGTLSCSKEDAATYANVSGTVTYNGMPLDKGQITYSIEGRVPSMMEIVDGKYSGQAMIGSNRVQIAAFRKATKERMLPETAKKQIEAYRAMQKGSGGESDPNMEDYIPPEWGKESRQKRVVEKGPNTFDFDIKGK